MEQGTSLGRSESKPLALQRRSSRKIQRDAAREGKEFRGIFNSSASSCALKGLHAK
jgi:hypothetical protein